MKILVIGGSYFLGKCFVHMAMKEHKVTVLNRGSKPLKLSSVTELCGDRRDIMSMSSLKSMKFDVVVDFCAYNRGDIELIFQALGTGIEQYIFVSTCDVYERGLNRRLDENAPFEVRDFGGEAGSYILGKAALENELSACAEKYNVNYTSVRPVFIYGPDNYAPREGIFFKWIEQAGQILYPEDANGEFQMVYVDDVALAIQKAIGNPEAYNQAFNLAPDDMETYETFANALAKIVERPFERIPVTVQMVNEKSIPLPFPLLREESNWYDGEKAKKLISNYTTLSEGLRKTLYLYDHIRIKAN